MRRALALVVGLVVAWLSPHSAGAADAVAFQVNIAHDGFQRDDALAPPFTRRWQVTLPGPVSYPLIAQGRVFVTARDDATGVSSLYALDPQSGHIVWSRLLTQPPPIVYPWANAAYDDGRVFAIGTAGLLTAFDAATGTPLWATQLPGQYLFSAPPTASHGIVYVGGAGTGGTLYAVDEATGNVLATQPVENGDASSPTLSGDGVFASYACNQAFGFAPVTLAPQWHYSTFCEGGGGKTVVYEGGRVYTRDFFGDLILDAATGELIGQYGESGNLPAAIPAIHGHTMWLQRAGSLVAYDVAAPTSPSILWSFTGDATLVTAPIVLSTRVGDFVVAGSASGMLYVLNAANGTIAWSTDVGAGLQAPDEQNVSQPLTGLAAGEGLLVVPAGNTVAAYVGTAPADHAAVPVPTLAHWALAALVALVLVSAPHLRTRRR